jgi:MraZ protein
VEQAVFNGTYQHQIDPKGRTSLPARFREVLTGQGADKLFVTTDLHEGCLQAYAPAQWNAFTAKVAALPQFKDSTRLIVRAMVAPAQECPFDKLGRIILTPQLRQYAGLQDEVVWVGSVERIELWSPQGWKKCEAIIRTPEVQATLAKELSELL